jgi:5-methylcytosine-specific restriction enzyme subunit McrC
VARRLALTEFKTLSGVALTVEERDALQRLHKGLTIEPTVGSKDRYDLTADQRIGLLHLPGLVLEIRPKVPISSVLFLISYACDAVGWLNQQTDFTPGLELVDLLAVMLSRLVGQATRRGLLNGYESVEEGLQAPRGRILFDALVARRAGRSLPIEVRHDVFTPDILENRLLLAALAMLLQRPLGSEFARRELFRAQHLFGGVARVTYSHAAVPDVVFTRLNRHYQAAISLATLLLRSASLDFGSGNARGSAFLIDMNLVFERFVRSALRAALGLDMARFPERVPGLRLDKARIVPLKPDLCIVDEARHIVWVGDAKYKRLPAGTYQNADLYQLLAYVLALGLPGGVLIYAADQGIRAAEHVVIRAGKLLSVIALDLSAHRTVIMQQIAAIAHRIRDQGLTTVS